MTAHVAEAMRRTPEMELAILPGLDEVEAQARDGHGREFTDLSEEQQRALVQALETPHPALLPTLTFLTYVAYYQQPSVITALGLEPRPPHPKGYEMAPNDLSLLDPVRRRGKRYRDA